MERNTDLKPIRITSRKDFYDQLQRHHALGQVFIIHETVGRELNPDFAPTFCTKVFVDKPVPLCEVTILPPPSISAIDIFLAVNLATNHKDFLYRVKG